MAKRIGICRALHAYHDYTLWQTYFEQLGLDVVLSRPTTRVEIDRGVRLAPAELCLPVKAFLGHVAEFEGKVDFLLLPRIVCRRLAGDLFFGCPKAMALPDLVRATFESLPTVVGPILDVQIHGHERAFSRAAVVTGARNGACRGAWRAALAQSRLAGAAARRDCTPMGMFSGGSKPSALAVAAGSVRVGVVGHSYLLFDDGLSLGILAKLRTVEAEPVVVLPDDEAVEREARTATALNWYYELELLAAARQMLEDRKVDGMLLVSSFACGTGAVTNELIQRQAVQQHGVPTVTLLLDEHAAEAGLMTRLESFVDLLRLRRP